MNKYFRISAYNYCPDAVMQDYAHFMQTVLQRKIWVM